MDAWRILQESPATPLVAIPVPVATEKNIQLWIKRDDLLQIGDDQAFCGNKFRKLKYNLLAAREKGYDRLLTFGGAFSNHIVATASAGRWFGFQTIGVIRGHPPPDGNASLRYAKACGMQLHYVDRGAYREKTTDDFLLALRRQFGDYYLIPEGGSNTLALPGCKELGEELLRQCQVRPLYVALACGTGGVLAGLLQGLTGNVQVLGFSALKGSFLTAEVNKLLGPAASRLTNWHIQNDYHFGGFAKFTPELIHFINQFKRQYGIALDPIYTGKLLWGVLDLIEQNYFPAGAQIVAIHTGGLQGIRGFNERFGPLIDQTG